MFLIIMFLKHGSLIKLLINKLFFDFYIFVIKDEGMERLSLYIYIYIYIYI